MVSTRNVHCRSHMEMGHKIVPCFAQQNQQYIFRWLSSKRTTLFMAIYTKKAQPTKNDLYETPTATLDMILDHLDPKRHLIWEPFVGTGHSTRYIKSRGFSVTNGDHQDFFQQSLPEKDPKKELVLVSNPPFSIKRHILRRLTELGFHKFALLLPAPVLFTQ